MFFVKTGYRMGTQAALSVLEGGAINKFISCASVLGMFMMGGLSASMVKVYTSAQIPTGEGTVMAIQGAHSGRGCARVAHIVCSVDDLSVSAAVAIA